MNDLNRDTLRLIETLYPDAGQNVARMLDVELGIERLGCDGWSSEQIERIHFAVLKLGQKSASALEKAKLWLRRIGGVYCSRRGLAKMLTRTGLGGNP